MTRPWADSNTLIRRLEALARQYPPNLIDVQLADASRIAFHLELVMSRHAAPAVVCDISGGVGLFSLGAAAYGFRAILIDDFRDPGIEPIAAGLLELQRRAGVDIKVRDVVREGLDLTPESIDAITAFEAIEHWHHSPKRMLREAVEALRPGGTLVIGAPNAVNLRKRITVPLGRGKWSSMHDWYEEPLFRGHVREPDVDDLRYIADDLALQNVKILGRNSAARRSPRRFARIGVRFIDRLLRSAPSLCSDIYLIGTKP